MKLIYFTLAFMGLVIYSASYFQLRKERTIVRYGNGYHTVEWKRSSERTWKINTENKVTWVLVATMYFPAMAFEWGLRNFHYALLLLTALLGVFVVVGGFVNSRNYTQRTEGLRRDSPS